MRFPRAPKNDFLRPRGSFRAPPSRRIDFFGTFWTPPRILGAPQNHPKIDQVTPKVLKKAKDLGRTAWNKIKGKNPPKIKPPPKGTIGVSTGKGVIAGGVTGPGVGGQLAGGVDQAKDDHERYGKYRDDIDQTKNKLRNAFGPSGRGY